MARSSRIHTAIKSAIVAGAVAGFCLPAMASADSVSRTPDYERKDYYCVHMAAVSECYDFISDCQFMGGEIDAEFGGTDYGFFTCSIELGPLIV